MSTSEQQTPDQKDSEMTGTVPTLRPLPYNRPQAPTHRPLQNADQD